MHARWPGRRPGTTRRLRVAAAAAVAAALPLAFVMPGAAQAGTGPAGAAPPPPGRAGGTAWSCATDRGWVRGKHAEGISQWLGIPYAAPPVGALRWAAPAARTALARDPRGDRLRRPVRPAGQRQRAAGGQRELPVPERLRAARRRSRQRGPSGRPGRGRPVLFMIHGGGLTTGAGRPARRRR